MNPQNNSIKYFTLLLIAVIYSAVGMTQEKGIPDADLKNITAEVNIISAKIEAVMKLEPAVMKKMKDELTRINEIKDTAVANEAIKNYMASNGAAYGNFFKKAGIDMNTFISEMNKKYPAYLFTLNSSFGIGVQMKTVQASSFKKGSTGTFGTTSTKSISSFTQSKSIDCGGLSGGSVAFGSRSLSSSAFSAFAGGCLAKGTLTNSTTLPAVASEVKLNLNFQIDAEGVAIGIVGSAASTASTFLTLNVTGISAPLVIKSIYKMGLAPFLWVAKFNASERFYDVIDLTEHRGKTIIFSLYTDSFSLAGLCCATTSKAKANIFTADLITTK